jgi:hypothetical protein
LGDLALRLAQLPDDLGLVLASQVLPSWRAVVAVAAEGRAPGPVFDLDDRAWPSPA